VGELIGEIIYQINLFKKPSEHSKQSMLKNEPKALEVWFSVLYQR
jgi:hypothetical protein